MSSKVVVVVVVAVVVATIAPRCTTLCYYRCRRRLRYKSDTRHLQMLTRVGYHQHQHHGSSLRSVVGVTRHIVAAHVKFKHWFSRTDPASHLWCGVEMCEITET